MAEALRYTIYLIAGIVFLAVIIFIVLKSGLVEAAKETMVTMVCTFSSYSRGMLISFIWKIASILIIVMTVMSIIAGASSLGARATLKIGSKILAKSTKLFYVFSGGMAAATSFLRYLGISAFVSLMVIYVVFSHIPLICPAMTVDVGERDKPVSFDKFVNVFGSRTIDCWNMMGAGNVDPLWGLDPPNPKICFTLETHLDTKVNMKQVFEQMYEDYKNSWKLGAPSKLRMYLYCYTDNGYESFGNNPNNWGGCKLQNSRIHIMFKDHHDYDLFSYGTAACGGAITKDIFFERVKPGIQNPFELEEDDIIICVDRI